jgi:hypothetical protein
VANLVLLGYVVYDDPASLYWCGGLVAVGVVLFLVENGLGKRDRGNTGDKTVTEA